MRESRGTEEGRIFRIIDANSNRAVEGIRVCEEMARFILSHKKLTLTFKSVRHRIVGALKTLRIDSSLLLGWRDSKKDAGKLSIESELKRDSAEDIFFANIQRAKESVRVLEEFTKLISEKAARDFKNIRYDLYQLEKETYPRLKAIRGN